MVRLLQLIGHQIIGITLDILARLEHRAVLVHHQLLQVRLAGQLDLLVGEQIDRAGIVRREQRDHGRVAQFVFGFVFVQVLDEDGARVVIHHHAVLVVLGVLHVARAARQGAGFALAPLLPALLLHLAHQPVVLGLDLLQVGDDQLGIVFVGLTRRSAMFLSACCGSLASATCITCWVVQAGRRQRAGGRSTSSCF